MLVMYKQKGETPLQALHRLRLQKPEYGDMSLSYAGRLDPMAEGVMVVLVDDDNKDREKYLGLDKTYVTEILFGIGTDTGDVLGIVQKVKKAEVKKLELEEKLQKSVGKFEQKYPAYSSKSFAGSYEDVRQGNVVEKSHQVQIYSADLIEVKEITASDLLIRVQADIAKVSGDFRQQEILETWQEKLNDSTDIFSVATIRLHVSSGFYVRQFAHDFGNNFGVPALALSILREQVGERGLQDCIDSE